MSSFYLFLKWLLFVFGNIVISECTNYCDINLTIDLPLFDHLKHDLHNVTKLVKENMKQMNKIYSNSIFQEDEYSVVFQVVNITVQDVCGRDRKCNEVRHMLEHFTNSSRSFAQNYCLNFLMTYRDFASGVVGLAWRGTVCNEKQFHPYNSGVVSKLNNGETQTVEFMAKGLAHEIGHSFGAPHDDTVTDEDCRANAGNFLMGEGGGDGATQFSRCSRECIKETLESILKSDQYEGKKCPHKNNLKRKCSNCFSNIKKIQPYPRVISRGGVCKMELTSLLALVVLAGAISI